MKNFFDLVAPIYGKFHIGAGENFKKITELGDFKESDKVLDLGGGNGRISKFLISKVQEITVVDVSEGMLNECKKIKGINCVRAFADNLPFVDEYFDKIIIVDAFHHFKNQEGAASEIKRVLNKSGKLIIEEFNPEKLAGWFIKIFETVLNMKSVFYTPASLSDFWSERGFDVKLFTQKSTYYAVLEKKANAAEGANLT